MKYYRNINNISRFHLFDATQAFIVFPFCVTKSECLHMLTGDLIGDLTPNVCKVNYVKNQFLISANN